VLGFRRAEKHTLPGGGGVEEPAQRMREREGAIEPRLGRSAARRHLGRVRERDKGEGGTKVRSRQGREEWRRRRRRVGGRRASTAAAAVAPARVGERRGERE